MPPIPIRFPASALIIVDVQNDFCPGGALEVSKGDMVVQPLNRLASLFASKGGRVVATQDWHPAGHVSFASSHEGKKPGELTHTARVKEQILWPDHCVQGSQGARFHQDLDTGPVNLIIRKGFRGGLDSYSAFFENDLQTSTGLDGFLKSLSIDALVLGGLAADYCVLYSALDAAALGYKTFVASDAVRAVDIPEGSAERAMKLLGEAGVIIAMSKEFE
ncbi:MAG: bifunctional nicotinamidase/pyrazinamidase [Treponema sp.]|nr:bifunctional nicotinamidase/pyrazinamidase [Treponema sp.]